MKITSGIPKMREEAHRLLREGAKEIRVDDIVQYANGSSVATRRSAASRVLSEMLKAGLLVRRMEVDRTKGWKNRRTSVYYPREGR